MLMKLTENSEVINANVIANPHKRQYACIYCLYMSTERILYMLGTGMTEIMTELLRNSEVTNCVIPNDT